VRITSQTYAHTRDDPPAPAAEPAVPDSAIVASAARLVARCKEFERGIASYAPGAQPIALIKLTAAAHRLVLEARAFGDARDAAAAAEAESWASAVEASWLAVTASPAPVPTAVVETPEAPLPVGRVQIGSLVHRWDEQNGKCVPAFVVEIHGGAPAHGVAVTKTNPYLAVIDAGGDRGRPVNARWIAQPVRDPQPGFRPPIVSWHRGTPAECPGWRS